MLDRREETSTKEETGGHQRCLGASRVSDSRMFPILSDLLEAIPEHQVLFLAPRSIAQLFLMIFPLLLHTKLDIWKVPVSISMQCIKRQLMRVNSDSDTERLA
jgi:hypothetical protein